MNQKCKKVLALVLVVLHICTVSTLPCFAKTYENITDLGLQSKSAILMDGDTGTVVYEQNSHEKLPPASVTKVMTLLLIYEAQKDGKIKWEDTVTVSEHAASMGGSQVFLEAFEQQSARDLTKCIAIASANDAAVAMAEYIGGSEDGFVALMNQRAKELGMAETNFVNACGLDADGHVTSAHDIAVMSRELIVGFPEIIEYTTTWQDTITHKTKKGESEFGLTNTNKLLKWYDGATGLKTGSTGKALYCLSGTAEKNGLKLIGVVMAAPDFKIRFQEVMKLLDYGFANYALQKGLAEGEVVGEIPVAKGEKETVEMIVDKEISFLAQKGQEGELTQAMEVAPSLQAPVAAGAKCGEIIYKVNGEEVGRTDAVAKEEIGRITLGTMLLRLMQAWY